MEHTLSQALLAPLLQNTALLIPHLCEPGGVNLAALYEPFEHFEQQCCQEMERFDRLQEQVHDVQRTLNEHLCQQRTDDETRLSYTLHDVKNMLTGLMSCLEVLNSDGLEQEEREEFIRLIMTDIRRILRLLHDFGTFTHQDSRASQSPVWSLADLIVDVCSMLSFSFSCYGISIRTNLGYAGLLNIDRWKMKHVILNIAYNARDAMPEGGTFTISSFFRHNRVHLEFSDTGCGMSPKLQARFLEPRVTEGKSYGSGMGMAIVKEIVDAYSGRIEVESVPKQGTTLRLSFLYL